jgi:hypothetical protein
MRLLKNTVERTSLTSWQNIRLANEKKRITRKSFLLNLGQAIEDISEVDLIDEIEDEPEVKPATDPIYTIRFDLVFEPNFMGNLPEGLEMYTDSEEMEQKLQEHEKQQESKEYSDELFNSKIKKDDVMNDSYEFDVKKSKLIDVFHEILLQVNEYGVNAGEVVISSDVYATNFKAIREELDSLPEETDFENWVKILKNEKTEEQDTEDL